jgi:hypothetical protein
MEDGDEGCRRIGFDPPADFKSIDIGEFHIEYDQIGVSIDKPQGFFATGRLQDFKTGLLEDATHGIAARLIIIDV